MSRDASDREPRHTNRLAEETSPYLLQHAHNPVDWYPWGEEALDKARREDKPILLSIGYSACHWCHVMERESFEDERIAEILNERFVAIKVDREERPDLDDIYMTSVQMMTGQGGWPLNVFLTPELKPFYGGTYFPPSDRMGMPSFSSVLTSVAEAWEQRRDRIEEAGEHLRQKLAETAGTAAGDGEPDDGEPTLRREPLERALGAARQRFDSDHGGFSQAPKFPHAGTVRLLLRLGARGEDAALHMAVHTLERMAAGGIYDHLGGGFARYSVDDRWLVPHFEKMLYDNAQLATAYVEAYQATGRDELARVARETLDWVIRDMQGEHGGYFSTLDADSEGEEGRFYVWTREEIEEVLGPDDAHAFALVYDVTDVGNWEGVNILNRSDSSIEEVAAELGEDVEELRARLDDARAELLEVRERRVWPGLDDKVLADWSGLMIAAMARGHRALGDERYLESARRAARFVLDEMTPDGRLLHAWRDGEAKVQAFLDDHADMLVACIELYEATFEVEWLERARELANATIELFGEGDDGALYFTGSDHEELLTRPRSAHDGSTPSGNGMAATGLLRLETLTGERAYGDRGRHILGALASRLERQPLAHAQLLLALDYHFRSPTEVVVVGPEDDAATREAISRLWRRFAPNTLIVRHDPQDPDAERAAAALPLLEGKGAPEAEADGPAFYVCENYACQAPTRDLEEALEALTP